MLDLRWSRSRWRTLCISQSCSMKSLRQAMDWKRSVSTRVIHQNSQNWCLDFQINLKIMLPIWSRLLRPKNATKEWNQWCSKFRKTESSKSWVRLILRVQGVGVGEAAWNRTTALRVKEALKATEATRVAGVEFRRNLEDLVVKEVEVPRNQGARVQEEAEVETKSYPSCRDHTQIIPHNKP